jgi:hypothetical protein
MKRIVIAFALVLAECGGRTIQLQPKQPHCGVDTEAMTVTTCTFHDGTQVVMTHDLTWDRQ